MLVTAAEIREQFDGLLSGERTRDEIERWAEERLRAENAGQLHYEPRSEEQRLWQAITYLLGVGLRATPDEYLHSPEDFLAFRREVGV